MLKICFHFTEQIFFFFFFFFFCQIQCFFVLFFYQLIMSLRLVWLVFLRSTDLCKQHRQQKSNAVFLYVVWVIPMPAISIPFKSGCISQQPKLFDYQCLTDMWHVTTQLLEIGTKVCIRGLSRCLKTIYYLKISSSPVHSHS